MAQIRSSTAIEGVYIAELQSHGDERGRFTEVYRKEWFPQRGWDALQWSRSESQQGVLRGLPKLTTGTAAWVCCASGCSTCAAVRRRAGRGKSSS